MPTPPPVKGGRCQHIAVVGLGFSGISLLAHICLQYGHLLAAGKLVVTAFERSEEIDGGIAWGNDCSECHLSNLRTGLMRIADGWVPSFASWLKEDVGRNIEPVSYLPRRNFGRYLQAQLNSIKKKYNQRGIHIITGATVTAVTKTAVGAATSAANDGFEVHTSSEPSNKQCHFCDNVILCIGASSAVRNVLNLKGNTQDPNNSVFSPFPAEPILARCLQLRSSFGKAARVCVVGTGLTAIDAVKSLRQGIMNGSVEAPIIMASRHAILPFVKRRWADPRVAAVSEHALLADTIALAMGEGPVSLNSVLSAFEAELENREGDEELLRPDYNCVPDTPYPRSQSVTTDVHKAIADWEPGTPAQRHSLSPQMLDSKSVARLRTHCQFHTSSQLLAYQNAIVAFEDVVIPQVWKRIPQVMWSPVSLARCTCGCYIVMVGLLATAC